MTEGRAVVAAVTMLEDDLGLLYRRNTGFEITEIEPALRAGHVNATVPVNLVVTIGLRAPIHIVACHSATPSLSNLFVGGSFTQDYNAIREYPKKCRFARTNSIKAYV
jgi:hypothetical protein